LSRQPIGFLARGGDEQPLGPAADRAGDVKRSRSRMAAGEQKLGQARERSLKRVDRLLEMLDRAFCLRRASFAEESRGQSEEILLCPGEGR
jgi:hypothetical protein